MASKYYWIKERHNPQFDKPYYVAQGQMTVKDARKMETQTLYGDNVMHKFSTKEAYENRLKELNNTTTSLKVH